MPKLVHFRDNCIGCNSCVEISEQHWEMDPRDGKSNLKRSKNKNGVFVCDICPFEVEANKKAGKDCPVGIIRVLDDKGKDITHE